MYEGLRTRKVEEVAVDPEEEEMGDMRQQIPL